MYRVLDVTKRISGIASLGVRRYIVLIEGGGSPDRNRLLDLKEARPSVLLGCTEHSQPDTGGGEAGRIVSAQRRLQAKPADGLAALVIEDRSYRMREMTPEADLSRSRLLTEKRSLLRILAEVTGRLTGWSHVRGSRLDDENRSQDLRRWAASSALDSVFVAAVRCAERTRRDYSHFVKSR
jgi:uncharacterized protein (DUF2252 family)